MSIKRWSRWIRTGLGLVLSSLVALRIWAIAVPAPVEAALPTQLQVATRVISPFVMNDNNQLTGFSIDLWNKITEQLGIKSNLTVYPTFPQMVAAIDSKKADVAISAISITAERDEKYDFSLPIFTSGLQILVRSSQQSGIAPNLLRDIFSPAILQIIALTLGLVVIASHLIWLLERKHPNSNISEQYFPGIFQAAWWSAGTLAAQAEEMPRSPYGRVMAIFWMFVSVLFITYFTATITTSMTVGQLQGDIRSIDDLQNRVVATTSGSSAAKFLRDKRIQTKEFDKIESAYDALLAKETDAVVFDAPVLLYYASHDGQNKVQLVGGLIREENYGILMRLNSPLRKPISTAILMLRENGTYQAIYDKWFKTEAQS